MSYLLTIHAYKVIPATSGQEAISLFSHAQIDLVLSDFAMPVMNGSQLITHLKGIASHIPMILLGDPTAYAGQVHRADALLSKKLTTPEELLERVKMMSARKRGPRKGTLRVEVPAEITTGAQATA